MPTPDQMSAQQEMSPRMFDAIRQQGELRGGNPVAEELAAMREEIAALRALLSPPSALILTGAEVIEHFSRLRHKEGA